MARGKAPAGFDEIHRILGGAMRAADRATWPARPHLGGPLPLLSTYRQVEVGLVLGAHARAAARGDDVAYVEQMTALATETLHRRRAKAYSAAEHRDRLALDATSRARKRDTPIQRGAKLIVRAAMNDRYAQPSARNVIGACVENAAVAFVEHLGNDVRAVRALLAAIDAAIVRAELASQLLDKGLKPTSALARVVSRPRGGRGKSLGLALAELADGRYGLLVKLRQEWSWHEGDRATMFATVPDEYMERVSDDLDHADRAHAPA